LSSSVIAFYEAATGDYRHWSRDLNMHLGCFHWGMSPFDREAMLEEMNQEVARRLRLDPETRATLLDLGCGTGAVARSIARTYPESAITGVTITRSQIATANELNLAAGLGQQITTQPADFTSLPFDANSVDGVWAIESACYASGPGKEDLIREMARVLRPGGRFVVADCFVRNNSQPFDPFTARCYRSACRSWALEEMPALDHFTGALARNGFRDVAIEDISWQVAPSVMHAPFAVLSFVLKKFFAGERLGQHSRNNLKASLLAVLLGLNRRNFSYCLISGRLDAPHVPDSLDVR
jgi:ubiquinone/menaquinone biosynthesis C-methylase UbiE